MSFINPEASMKKRFIEENSYIKKKIYSFPIYPYRLLKSFYNLKNVEKFYLVKKFNQAMKKSWQNSHYYSKYPHTL